MPARLWVAVVSFDFVVLAEDESEATETANDHVREELANRSGLRDAVDGVYPLVSLAALPDQWDGDCIPWGSEDDKTCAEVMAEGEG